MPQARFPLEVRYHPVTGQRHLHSQYAYPEDAVITMFSAAKILPAPTYLTLQTGVAEHIILSPELLQYCNHSCDPNVFFDTTAMAFRTIKPVGAGDELTFFYPSTEWEMAQSFSCFCGSAHCIGEIKGASGLPLDLLSRYKLSDFILEELDRKRILPVTAMIDV